MTKRKTTFLERAALAASPYERARRFLAETIWQIDPDKVEARWKRWGILALRVVYLSGRGLASSRTQLQASALTYTTILALVPFFAVVFSLFQGFVGLQGAGELLQDFIIRSIAASPDQEVTLHEYLQKFVENTQKSISTGGGIAGIAFIFLVFTVVTLLSSIESTLNDVWGVKRARTFTQKFITYWAVATLGPVLLSIALVAGTTFGQKLHELSPSTLYEKWRAPAGASKDPAAKPADLAEPDYYFSGVGGALAARHTRIDKIGSDAIGSPRDELRYILTGRVPTKADEDEQRGVRWTSFLLTAVAFSLLYAFMPNTTVKMKPAFVGGFFAAAAFGASKWALASGSNALVKYNTIYGGLATIPILMFWFYIAWLIVILGAELTFAIQNLGSQGKEELAKDASPRCREVVALRIMTKIATAFDAGQAPSTLSSLAKELGAPHALASEIVFHLCEVELLREIDVGVEERGYVPARPLGAITLGEVGRAVRDLSGINFDLEGGADATFIQGELARADAAERETIGSVTLESVVRAVRSRPEGAPAAAASPGPSPTSAPTSPAPAAAQPTSAPSPSTSSGRVARVLAAIHPSPAEAPAPSSPGPAPA